MAKQAGHELLQAEGVVCALCCSVRVNLGMAMARAFSLLQINWAPLLREEKVAPGLVAGDVTAAFLVCHPQRMSVAGEKVGSVGAPGPVNHGQRRGGNKSSAHEEGIVQTAADHWVCAQ